ncbi:MAG: RadC family protein [Leadbetterella sp.]
MQNNNSIKNWAVDDRPREKMILKGRESLSDAELLAILIGNGNSKMSALQIAQEVLKHTNYQFSEIGKLSHKALTKFSGIGSAKAITILAAMEIGRRKSSEEAKKVTLINSNAAYTFFKSHLGDLNHEEMHVVFLDTQCAILGHKKISMGGIGSTVVDTRILFKSAIEHLATGLIICHNHPSGQLSPSEADIDLTRKIKSIGELTSITLQDHIIYSEKGYYSFKDEGKL